MEKMNMAQTLISGSAEIDRMKREVELLAGIIVGGLAKIGAFLPKRSKVPGREGIRYKQGPNEWIVGRIVETDKPFIELEVRPNDGCRTIYYSEWTDTSMSAEFVQMVHADMSRLIVELTNDFQDLRLQWLPLMRAAQQP